MLQGAKCCKATPDQVCLATMKMNDDVASLGQVKLYPGRNPRADPKSDPSTLDDSRFQGNTCVLGYILAVSRHHIAALLYILQMAVHVFLYLVIHATWTFSAHC